LNIAENLAREISRVTSIREHYAEIDGMPQVNVRPFLFMIDQALERAKLAAGIEDAVVQIEAVKELEGFSE
jgi:hypothetical protein